MSNNLIEVENLEVVFQTSGGSLTAVSDVSFKMKAGETLGIVGESAHQKSIEILEKAPSLNLVHDSMAELTTKMQRGSLDLIAVFDKDSVSYRYDPANKKSHLTRLEFDVALQKVFGRKEKL